MPNLYKVEIFDRAYHFRGMALLGNPNIRVDYLTLERTTLKVKNITAQRGDFAHITDFDSNVLYQGIVEDINTDKNGTKLKLAPLLSLLDITVFHSGADSQAQSLEEFLASIVQATYGNNEDVLQNLPGLAVKITSSTPDAKIALESDVFELYPVVSKALTLYGILVSMELNPQKKVITCTIGKATRRLAIEAALPNCIDRNFVLDDQYGILNKATYINEDNPQEEVTYYLHPDGTVDTKNANRITPVFFIVEYIAGADSFAEDAANRAAEALTPQVYEQLIELTYRREDKMLNPASLPIGTLADIHWEGTIYQSILTGFEMDEGTILLIFGCIRMELTKKLILERRR